MPVFYLLTIVISVEEGQDWDVRTFRVSTDYPDRPGVIYRRFCDAWVTEKTKSRILWWEVKMEHEIKNVEL
jgi:hypothetical protein